MGSDARAAAAVLAHEEAEVGGLAGEGTQVGQVPRPEHVLREQKLCGGKRGEIQKIRKKIWGWGGG